MDILLQNDTKDTTNTNNNNNTLNTLSNIDISKYKLKDMTDAEIYLKYGHKFKFPKV